MVWGQEQEGCCAPSKILNLYRARLGSRRLVRTTGGPEGFEETPYLRDQGLDMSRGQVSMKRWGWESEAPLHSPGVGEGWVSGDGVSQG